MGFLLFDRILKNKTNKISRSMIKLQSKFQIFKTNFCQFLLRNSIFQASETLKNSNSRLKRPKVLDSRPVSMP